jgi:hypothetical protein
MNEIFGLIVFTLTLTLTNGNLQGRWMNRIVPTFQIENANRNSGDINEFVGSYN